MPEVVKLYPAMDGSYRLRSFFEIETCRRGCRGFVLIVMALCLSIVAAVAQETSRKPDGIAIHGTVFDRAGKTVGDVLVRLEQEGRPDSVTATDPQGVFVFQALRPGNYLVSAEKSELRSRLTAVTASIQTEESHIDLVLEASDVPSNSGALSPSSAEGMAFADKPNFTVAGITDWTAVGGHGSDSSLRTSEALARETATLKPKSSVGTEAGSTSTGVGSESEGKLRAALAEAPNSFEANHQLGEFCFRKGSYREAVPLLKTAYRIDPANHDNEYNLALAYKEAGNFAQARQHIEKLLAHEDNADLRRVSGDLDEEMGDSLAAVRAYEQAVRLDPSEQNYFAWGSELLLHRAVWPAAEVFRKGTEAHPKSARMLAALGAALFASALYDEAALRLCEASDLNPADPGPYVFLGKIDMAAPAPLACVEPKLMRFVQEQPGDARANYYSAMAIWKRQKGTENPQEMQQIESLLTKAVAADPKYDEAYLQLGNLYAGERNSGEAIRFYKKAIEVNPQLGEAHYRLGVAYERAGEPVEAKQEFQVHDEIEKVQAAAVERQRQEVKQFLVVLQGKPVIH
jgi:tetratricopeptide (TPR) repeat protein